ERGDPVISRSRRSVHKTLDVDEGQSRVGDLDPVLEKLHHRAGARDREVLMDEGIGHQLPDRDLGIHPGLRTQRLSDHLPLWHGVVDEADEPREAGGISFPAELLLDGLDPVGAAVEDDPHGLAPEVLECVEVFRQQHGSQVRDVEPAVAGGEKEPLGLQLLEHAVAILGKALSRKVEVRRVVEKREGLGRWHRAFGDPLLKSALPGERGPELALLFGIVPELLLVAADPHVLGVLEADRRMSGSRDLEEHEGSRLPLDLMDPEIDSREQQAREPALELFIPDPGGPRAKSGPYQLMGAVGDSPNDEAGLLAMEGCGVGERRQVLADLHRIGVVPLELHPFRLIGQACQAQQQLGEVFGAHPLRSFPLESRHAHRPYTDPGSRLTQPASSSSSSVARTRSTDTSRRTAICSATRVEPGGISASTWPARPPGGSRAGPGGDGSVAGGIGTPARGRSTSRMSVGCWASWAPSRMRPLAPSELSSKIRPGTAQTSRPRSSAWRAVISEPERVAACTTSVPAVSAASERLRSGKCQARGMAAQGNSETRAPRAAISAARRTWPRG